MSFVFRKGSERRPQKPVRRVAPASIIAVASGKGGVGKTFMSITLASAYAQAGKRTLLVDGDLGLANVDVQLGISPETDLAAVMSGWVELDDAVVAVDGGAGAGGFDVLPGRSGSGALAELPPDDVARLAAGLSALALRYDQVIVDLGAGIEANCMRLARAADKALMVITDEPTSMTDAYAFIKVLRGYAPNVEPVIAINQADDRASGKRTYEGLARACQKFLGFRPLLAGVVLRDDRVREAIRRQTTLISSDPSSQAIQDTLAIAHALLGDGVGEGSGNRAELGH